MISSWFATAKCAHDHRRDQHRSNRPVRADPGGQNGELFIVALHPGHGEDRRHHADHAAKVVEEKALVNQIVAAHDLEHLDHAIGPLGEFVQVREGVDDDEQADE